MTDEIKELIKSTNELILTTKELVISNNKDHGNIQKLLYIVVVGLVGLDTLKAMGVLPIG